MSLKNRKKHYDELVALSKLDERHYERLVKTGLIQEFGDPKTTEIDINFSAMTKKQLVNLANDKKLDFTSKATKDDLIVLLETASDKVRDETEPVKEPVKEVSE